MDPYLCSLIDQLEQEHTLSASQWIQLLNGRTPELAAYLFEKSRRAQIRFYGHTDVQLRTSEHRSMYSYVRLSIDRCTATYV